MDDFVSDGCTLWFDVWRGIDLTQCCYAHDLAWYQHPDDWVAWFYSNLELAVCFAKLGVYEVAIVGFIAVSTIGALVFAFSRKKHRGQVGR